MGKRCFSGKGKEVAAAAAVASGSRQHERFGAQPADVLLPQPGVERAVQNTTFARRAWRKCPFGYAALVST